MTFERLAVEKRERICDQRKWKISGEERKMKRERVMRTYRESNEDRKRERER
jgi:hypothetical protein